MTAMALRRGRQHPAWCAQQHDRRDNHEGGEISVALRWMAGRGAASIDADLADIGTPQRPDPVVRLWDDWNSTAALLTPSEALELAQHLTGLAARAEKSQ